MPEKIVVCGAGGYVGRHLVASLVEQGHEVVVVSRKHLEPPEGASWVCGDLLDSEFCGYACQGATRIYNLAATVGGIGFIQKNAASCMASAAININLLRARPPGLLGYFFASSSCVYPSSYNSLSEADVRPELLDGYGLEKYFSEKTCLAFHQDHGVPVRIARLHTVYGPDDFRGPGRDHFPSAMTEAVVQAKLSGIHDIKIWGDGKQTRSLLYIDDAVEGIQRIMGGSHAGPINLASSEVVSVESVVNALEDIAAVKLNRFYSPTAPTGAQNKTSNNNLLRNLFSWEPMTTSKAGLSKLYQSAWDRAMKK